MSHDYSGHEEVKSPEDMQRLTTMVDRLGILESEIERHEAEAKLLDAQARELRENVIPEMLQSMGLKEITTLSGLTVKIREEIRASFFTKEPHRREPAFEWLRKNHHDGLIKNTVSAQFNREQQKLAEDFVAYCKQFGHSVDVQQKQDIHNQTLCAFLRERLREGEEVPLELFGAFVQKFAKIDRR